MKKVEFHDAQIAARLRVMNEDGSTEQVVPLQPTMVCSLAGAEWDSVLQRIYEAIAGVEKQVNGNSDTSP